MGAFPVVTFYVLTVIVTVTILYSDRGESFLFGIKLAGGLIVASAAVGWVYLSKWRDAVKLRFHIIDLLLFVSIAYLIIISLYVGRTIDNAKFFTLYLSCLTYILVRRNSNNRCSIGALLFGFSFLNLIEGLIGLLQLSGLLKSLNPLFQITGTFKNPTPYALFLSISSSAPVILALWSKNKRTFGVNISIWIICVVAVAFSDSRAAWLSMIVSTSIIFLVRFKLLFSQVFNSRIGILLTVLSTLLILSAVLCLLYHYKKASSDTRLFVWEVTLNKIAQKPLLGHGYGSFKESYNNWQTEYFLTDPSLMKKNYYNGLPVSKLTGHIRMAYNEFIELTVEQGLFGLSLFIIITSIALIHGWKSLGCDQTPYPVFAFANLVAVLTAATFSYPFYSLPTFLLLSISLASIANSSKGGHFVAATLNTNYNRIISIFLASLCVFIINFSINYLVALNSYSEANDLFARNLKISAGKKYRDAYQRLKDDPLYLVDYSVCLIDNGDDKGAYSSLTLAETIDSGPDVLILKGNILKKWKRYDEAENYYKKAQLAIPSAVYPSYLLVKLYLVWNEREKALSLARRVVSVPPKVKNTYTINIYKELENLINK